MCYDFKEEAKEFVKKNKFDYSPVFYCLYVMSIIIDIGCMSYFAITKNINHIIVIPTLIIINMILFAILSAMVFYVFVITFIRKRSFKVINGLIAILNDANVPTDFTSDEYFNLVNEHIKKIEQDMESNMKRYYNKKLKKD